MTTSSAEWTYSRLMENLVARIARGLPGASAQRRFAPELAYGRHAGPAPRDARRAAVLVLLYPHEEEWFIPTLVRTQGMREHAGQIALPGGTLDAGEQPVETALREFEEELGAPRQIVEIVGSLTPIYVFNSNFDVFPILGLARERPAFRPSADEVAELVEVPVTDLLDPAHHASDLIERRGLTFRAPHMQIGSHRVWGATSMILAEVMALLA